MDMGKDPSHRTSKRKEDANEGSRKPSGVLQETTNIQPTENFRTQTR